MKYEVSNASLGRELLFPSHPETRVPIALYKAQGAPPRPATHSGDEKNRRNLLWFLLRQHVISSYGGITHIRFKGRRSYLPLSLSLQAPLRFSVVGRLRVSPVSAPEKDYMPVS